MAAACALATLPALASAADFDGAVADLVRDISALAPLAVRETKRSINEIANGQPDVTAMRARETLTNQSQDFAEGRLAFQEKRKPVFQGR